MQPLKRLLKLCTIALVSACASIPSEPKNIPICVSAPIDSAFFCSDLYGKRWLVPFEDSDNYIAIPEEFVEELLK